MKLLGLSWDLLGQIACSGETILKAVFNERNNDWHSAQ